MSLIETTSKRMWRSYSVITELTVEPITVEELKLFARIDNSDEDTLLEGFIVATRQAAEQYLNRALLCRKIRLVYDEWFCRTIELPSPPLISIDGVYTVDEDGVTTEYSSDNYYIVTEHLPGQLVIKRSATMPINTTRDTGGYRVEYFAGYGELATDVPQQIREALKLWATALYENRAITTEPPPEARSLLDIYKLRLM